MQVKTIRRERRGGKYKYQFIYPIVRVVCKCASVQVYKCASGVQVCKCARNPNFQLIM